jgi:hypothetical protein
LIPEDPAAHAERGNDPDPRDCNTFCQFNLAGASNGSYLMDQDRPIIAVGRYRFLEDSPLVETRSTVPFL